MRRSSVVAAVALTLAASGRASAYCRTTTGGLAVLPGNVTCEPGKTGATPEEKLANCCSIGDPIWWRTACVGFSMHVRASQKGNISYPLASRTLAKAFRIWTNASCTGGETSSRVSIDVRQLASTECSNVETKIDGSKNQNVIVFRDAVWNHADPDKTLGLTTVKFTADGEIRGADLEFNTANHNLVCPVDPKNGDPEVTCFDEKAPEGAFDFASVVTHEVGHFLGLGHSNDPNATMAAQYANEGNNFTLRTLAADDIAGICSAYRPDGTRSTGPQGKTIVPQGPCNPAPYNGFSVRCDEDDSCAVSPGSLGFARRGGPGAPGRTAFWAAGLLLAAAYLRRRQI